MAVLLHLQEYTGLRPAVALPLLAVVLALVGLISKPIYNIYFHPLRSYPGPKLWAATRLTLFFATKSGLAHIRIQELHEKYGEVVRIAPDQVSYLHPGAWKEIMGHRKSTDGTGSGGENGKDPVFYHLSRHSVIGSNREDHSRYRRILSHSFSAQSMLDQQPLIGTYVDLLIQRLHEHCEKGTKALDMTAWFNFTTFDIIGDLTFGESFDCLESSTYHPWIAVVFSSIKQLSFLTSVRYMIPSIDSIFATFFPSLINKVTENNALVNAKVIKRAAEGSPRPDFMTSMLSHDGPSGKLKQHELTGNSRILVIAGSETTATALSGITYFLGTHPAVLSRLAAEVRDTFPAESSIDLLSVQKLPYLAAVVEESLRMFPPVPTALPRSAKPGGDVICGRYVPGGTVLDVWQWPMYRSASNFHLPNEFLPERWLGEDERFADDKRECFQPFSHGARNCIGRNLAYAEMRLILSRLLWNFDLKLDDGSKDWMDKNTAFMLWQKGELDVYLTPRKID